MQQTTDIQAKKLVKPSDGGQERLWAREILWNQEGKNIIDFRQNIK